MWFDSYAVVLLTYIVTLDLSYISFYFSDHVYLFNFYIWS